MMMRSQRKNVVMVDRPQIKRDDKVRKADDESGKHEPRLGVAVGRGCFVIEETLQKMAQQVGELAPLRLADRSTGCLRAQRENVRVRHKQDAF